MFIHSNMLGSKALKILNQTMIKRVHFSIQRHPEGVVKVNFSSVEAADLCIASMDGRLYCGKKLSVAAWDGVEKFM